jgi:hypothetical protein
MSGPRSIFSNTYAFEKWRLIPESHRRLLKNEFFNNLLVGEKRDRCLARLSVDINPHFAVFILFVDRRGIIGATAPGNNPGIENSGPDTDKTRFPGDSVNHHADIGVEGMAAGRQPLLQGELAGTQLLKFAPENGLKAGSPPGR